MMKKLQRLRNSQLSRQERISFIQTQQKNGWMMQTSMLRKRFSRLWRLRIITNSQSQLQHLNRQKRLQQQKHRRLQRQQKKTEATATPEATEETEATTTPEVTEAASYNTDSSLEVTDGNKVNIDYVGKIDGVAFDGGSTDGKGTDLVIGSGTYIDNFEEQLIGAHPGDKVEVTVVFPDDYQAADLAGKEAVFDVTVNGIYE